LASCFTRTFVDGLHAPSKRADAAEWELALYRTMQRLHPLPSGKWTILGAGQPNTSLRGDERLTVAPLVVQLWRETERGMVDEHDQLVLFHHLMLHDWHLSLGVSPNERADRTPRGYVAQHGGKWWLVNTSDTPWYGADGAATGRNASVECVSGLSLRIGDVLPARVLRLGATG
jgi:hypothetical protein